MKATAFTRHVYAVQHYVRHTAARYEALMKLGIVTHPICCFGNVETAKVVTVGVNPSWGEFERPRWPEEIDHADLAQRCLTYFDKNLNREPHPWFGPWEEALGHINCSYEDGSAVHLDLSPRATRYISDFRTDAERELFLGMAYRDLWIFFATLSLCENVKLILLAGSITKKAYLNEFLIKHAADYGWRVDGTFCRKSQSGEGKTCWHSVRRSRLNIPTFFCSSSPSANNPHLLPERIGQHKLKIFTAMSGGGQSRTLV